jgi:iron complex transport system substrate-binding protein
MFARKSLLVLFAIILTSALVIGACVPAGEPVEPAVADEELVAEETTVIPQEDEQAAEETVAESEPSQALVLVDGLGREVVLDGPAQRIVSIAPSNTEILYAVGAGEQVVGREDYSDFPPEVLEITSIGTTFDSINTEALVALSPDLVLAAGLTPPEQIEAVQSLGIDIFALENPLDFEGLYTNLATVGTITGHEAEAESLVAELQGRVNAVLDALSGADTINVYYEVDGTDPTSPWTTGVGTFQDYLITQAGGANVAAEIDAWGQISLEQLVVMDPEVIIFGEGAWVPTTAESLSDRAGWADISAVLSGQIFALDTNLTDRPGPRMVDAFELVAQSLHPELFD